MNLHGVDGLSGRQHQYIAEVPEQEPEQVLREAVFMPRKEVAELEVLYPEYLKDEFWHLLENGQLQSAKKGFAEVEKAKFSDYTAPSRYGIAYIEYQLKNFKESAEWFE